mmetsp:Transcript_87440/g.255702  ORF Transcript_87440/g.255702 Transcript_87440/m.255702 type:complete len:287 (+) Transcript_87440:68-928(+)
MTHHLEVACNATPGDQLGVSGEDPALGEWDLSRAVRLELGEGAEPTWRGSIPALAGGSPFKLVLFKGTDAAWEPLAECRRWPSHGLGGGSALRMRYGEPRISVEVGADHLEANARAVRKLEERSGSALQSNVDQKGENAYYYAHTRKFEVPEHAKVISGPGLITGGAPVLIESGAMVVDATAEERTVWLKDYSWADAKGKVKVYIPVPEGVLPAEGAEDLVEADYTTTQAELTIKSKPRQRLRIERLNAEIKADACSVRVEAHKSRVVLQLAKKRETTWYSLTKSK